MASIKLQGLSFYAHHGYYTHERTRGNNYLVDVIVDMDIAKAALTDDLHQTLNYEIIYQVCSDVMEHPCHLIETVAYRIAHGIRDAYEKADAIHVTVYKVAPELGGPVQNAQVTYSIKNEVD